MGVQSNVLAPNIPFVPGDTSPCPNDPDNCDNYAQCMVPYTNLSFCSSPTQAPLVRYQFLYPLGTNGPNGNIPMGTDLDVVLDNGLAAGANNIEIYPQDIFTGGSPNNDPAIATFNQEVGAP
jgi:hypothetical protein